MSGQDSTRVVGARENNLKDVSLDIPTGVVTGVAGAGKSSLIFEAFRRDHPEAVLVDQSPIPTSSRSTPATYLGLMGPSASSSPRPTASTRACSASTPRAPVRNARDAGC